MTKVAYDSSEVGNRVGLSANVAPNCWSWTKLFDLEAQALRRCIWWLGDQTGQFYPLSKSQLNVLINFKAKMWSRHAH